MKAASSRLVDAITVSYLTGYSVYTVRKMARTGALPARKVGRTTRFVLAEVEEWIATLPKAAA